MWENAQIFVVAKNQRKNRKNVRTTVVLIAKIAPKLNGQGLLSNLMHIVITPCKQKKEFLT